MEPQRPADGSRRLRTPDCGVWPDSLSHHESRRGPIIDRHPDDLSALGVRREDVFISLVEVPRENWSFGNGEMQYQPAP